MKPQGKHLHLIRETYRHDTVKKGEAFAELFMRVARKRPGFRVGKYSEVGETGTGAKN